jgi:hypothetical protein
MRVGILYPLPAVPGKPASILVSYTYMSEGEKMFH